MRRKITQEIKDAIRRYYTETPEDTFSVPELAGLVGLADVTVTRYATRMGLTRTGRRHTTEVRARIGEKAAKRIKEKGHPRGALGLIHSEEVREKSRERAKRMWATSKAFGINQMSSSAKERRRAYGIKWAAQREASGEHSRAKPGRRDDLGDIWFRSSWEANYARFLNLLVHMKIVEEWSYEPQTYWFEGVKRGTVSYKPDFHVKYKNDPRPEVVEIKGWVTDKDKTKWKRMAKYHPTVKLVIIGVKEYREITNKWSSAIPLWEKSGRPAFARFMGKNVPL